MTFVIKFYLSNVKCVEMKQKLISLYYTLPRRILRRDRKTMSLPFLENVFSSISVYLKLQLLYFQIAQYKWIYYLFNFNAQLMNKLSYKLYKKNVKLIKVVWNSSWKNLIQIFFFKHYLLSFTKICVFSLLS